MSTKYNALSYRENTNVRPDCEFMRCQVGQIKMEKHAANVPMEPVFHLLGFGATMSEAEQMVERRLGR